MSLLVRDDFLHKVQQGLLTLEPPAVTVRAWAEGDGYYHVDQVVPERPEIPDGAQSLFWAYNGIQVCSQDTDRALPLSNRIVRLMGGATLKKCCH